MTDRKPDANDRNRAKQLPKLRQRCRHRSKEEPMFQIELDPYLRPGQKSYQACIEACVNCWIACETCADACLDEPDIGMMLACIRLDRHCAAICKAAAEAMLRGGAAAKDVCRACAQVCEGCGAECARHDAGHCRHCAAACLRCAQECRKMAA
jgi:hypothetical protein